MREAPLSVPDPLAAASAVPDDRPIWQRWWWNLPLLAMWLWQSGWGISALVHLAVLLSLTGVAYEHHQKQQQQLSIDSMVTQDTGDVGFDTVLQAPAPAAAGDLSEANRPSTLTSPALTAGAELTAESLINGSAALASAGAGGGGGLGGTGEAGDKGGGIGGIPFFGTQATGKSFVFVVDMSESMQGGRFKRAKAELHESIKKLKPEQKFFVIFFNDKAIPMFSPRPESNMLFATTSHKTRARRWINERKADGITNPVAALQMALELKPDAIFFLTDGELPDDVQTMTRRENTAHIVIHTIAFENKFGEGVLESIAKENGGTYRFVK